MSDEIVIRQGAKYSVSERGYYNCWYPSDEESKHGCLEEEIQGTVLRWQGGGGKWIPVIVTYEVALKYGSPVKVLWIDKEEIQNG